MPATCSGALACCMFGLYSNEPMMIPTSGSSTSISSKASSTAGIVVGRTDPADPVGCGSEISLTWIPLWGELTGDAPDCAGGDVAADLHSVEGDPLGRIVCTIAGRGRRRPQPGHVEHAPAGGDDLAVAHRGAGVGDLGQLGGGREPLDHVALGGGLRVAGRGEDRKSVV